MKTYIHTIIFTFILILNACKNKEQVTPDPESEHMPDPEIYYKTDGRSVKQSDPKGLYIDVNNDTKVDFVIFVQLFANSSGDHLYCAVNPIGENLIKSTLEDEEQFLNMGFLVEEPVKTKIDSNLADFQRWTGDAGTLVIRRSNYTSIRYDGSWKDNEPHIVGIQHIVAGKKYVGWLRIQFDKTNETITLIDYAYNTIEKKYILSGHY